MVRYRWLSMASKVHMTRYMWPGIYCWVHIGQVQIAKYSWPGIDCRVQKAKYKWPGKDDMVQLTICR